MVNTESRVWSDSGTEPDQGAEPIGGGEKYPAQWMNWALWALTKDIDTLASIVGSLESVSSITELRYETLADRPAARTAGRVSFVYDEQIVTVDDGEQWLQLGATTHNDLDGISSDDHHARYTDAEAQTAVEGSVSHNDLANISAGDHHAPVSTANPLSVDASQNLSLSLASMLTVDANGNLTIADGSIAEALLSFDPTTQSELNNHAGNASAHHSRYTNSEAISAVDGAKLDRLGLSNTEFSDSPGEAAIGFGNSEGYKAFENQSWTQIFTEAHPPGASDLAFDPATQSELNNHAGNNDAHHSRYTDTEAVSAVDGSGLISAGSATDISGSRSTGTEYANDTGNPLFVGAKLSIGPYNSADLVINGVPTDSNYSTSSNIPGGVSGIIPPGDTYRITNGSVNSWTEFQITL